MLAMIVYLLFLGFVYAVDGASFYFWLMAGIGIFVVAGSLIGVIVPGKKTKPETEVRHGKAGRQPATVYTYLSVYFLNRGNWYYYLTNDPTIRPNDVVVVPWGKNNNAELAIVGWIEQRTAADVPYPLSRMKYILRKASAECRPAFDEMIRWPMKVNISCRWTRDEAGNGFQVINDQHERQKLRGWISENPRLIPFEPMVIGERTENEKFWDAVRWYNIANSDW